jgi:hypothetical protein
MENVMGYVMSKIIIIPYHTMYCIFTYFVPKVTMIIGFSFQSREARPSSSNSNHFDKPNIPMNTIDSIVISLGLTPDSSSSYIVLALAFVLTIRIIQRIYYFSQGHQQYFTEYLPKEDLEQFFIENRISCKDASVVSGDGVKLKYRIIGEGKKVIYLGNNTYITKEKDNLNCNIIY